MEKKSHAKSLLAFIMATSLLFSVTVQANAASSPWPERFSMFTQISTANGTSYPGYVKAAQRMFMCLTSDTYDLIVGSGGTDGVFGSATYSCALYFQQDNNLVADGIIGTNSWRKMGENLLLLNNGLQGENKHFLVPSDYYLGGQRVITAFVYGGIYGIDFCSYETNGFLNDAAFHHFG
jgi:peptidoglycan hydrolase-like protein with peptidoglycan-binding domain